MRHRQRRTSSSIIERTGVTEADLAKHSQQKFLGAKCKKFMSKNKSPWIIKKSYLHWANSRRGIISTDWVYWKSLGVRWNAEAKKTWCDSMIQEAETRA